MDGIWRDGDLLIIGKGAQIPDRCIKCGQNANGKRIAINLVWSPYGVPVKPGITTILFWFSRKTARVEFGICDRHLHRRRTLVRAVIAVSILGAAIFGTSIALAETGRLTRDATAPFAMIGLGLAIFPVFAYAFWFPLVEPRDVSREFVALAGAGKPFLDELPPLTADK
jgi:hypothetical protein